MIDALVTLAYRATMAQVISLMLVSVCLADSDTLSVDSGPASGEVATQSDNWIRTVPSDQQRDPFMFLGSVVENGHPKLRHYRSSLASYQSVIDCLMPSEVNEETFDISAFDWERIGTGTNGEVCIFRVARTLEDLGEFVEWLERQGFSVGPASRFRSERYVPVSETDPVANIVAYWSVEQYRAKNPSLASSLFGVEMTSGYELVIQLDSGFQVVGVNAVTPIK